MRQPSPGKPPQYSHFKSAVILSEVEGSVPVAFFLLLAKLHFAQTVPKFYFQVAPVPSLLSNRRQNTPLLAAEMNATKHFWAKPT